MLQKKALHLPKKKTLPDKPQSLLDEKALPSQKEDFFYARESIENRELQKEASLLSQCSDRNFYRKIKQKKTHIQGTLDLHGLKQKEAYSALLQFIEKAYTEKKKTVCVITGKGNNLSRTFSEGFCSLNIGVLREKVPLWVAEGAFKKYVVSISQALPQHGGAGTYYVVLRKKRR